MHLVVKNEVYENHCCVCMSIQTGIRVLKIECTKKGNLPKTR